MARISYDDQTAAAYKAVREIPRDGLLDWREAVRRQLRPSPGMTVVDIGAGTGVFATAFSDWFGLSVLAVEPSAAMRAQIPARPARPGRPRGRDPGTRGTGQRPSAARSVGGRRLDVAHDPPHPRPRAAAREIRRVLRPGAPVLIRQGYPGRGDPARTFPWEFFPETARSVSTFPTVEQVCQAFGTAGFRREAIEPVPERWISLAGFLDQADTFRHSDTNLRSLTEEEYLRGKEQLRRAVEQAGPAARHEARTSWLELLVLR